MLKYIIGTVVGGLVGYFVLYRLIGCYDGTCIMTSNPYVSTIIGIALGIIFAMAIAPSNKSDDADKSSATEYKRITAAEAKARIDSNDEIIILDVGTKEQFDAGHIPNAVSMPDETIKGQMPEQLPQLDTEILIYCRFENRSAQAAKKLSQIGYTNIYNFGAMDNWPYDIAKE